MHGRVTVPDTSLIQLKSLTPDHWPDVRRIYLDGIATGNGTFEKGSTVLGKMG